MGIWLQVRGLTRTGDVNTADDLVCGRRGEEERLEGAGWEDGLGVGEETVKLSSFLQMGTAGLGRHDLPVWLSGAISYMPHPIWILRSSTLDLKLSSFKIGEVKGIIPVDTPWHYLGLNRLKIDSDITIARAVFDGTGTRFG